MLFVVSCKKETTTYPYPDYTAETEAEFPYRDLKEPLVYLYGRSDSIVFSIQSKTIVRRKNSLKPVEGSGLRTEQSQNLVTIEAPNFSYAVSAYHSGGVLNFEHSFRVYKFYTNATTSPLKVFNMMAGSPSIEITRQSDSLNLLGKTYYDVLRLETYSNSVLSGDVWINAVLFCRSHGVIGLYNDKLGRWYYLKPRK